MLKKHLRKQDGVLVSDAIISILVILLFAGVITTLIYNIVLESIKVKTESQKIAIFTDIFEYVEKTNYLNITEDSLCSYINSADFKINNVSAVTDEANINTLTTAYKVVVELEQYNQTEGNTDKYDLIKKVSVTIENTLSGQTYSTEMSTIRKATSEETREIVESAQEI